MTIKSNLTPVLILSIPRQEWESDYDTLQGSVWFLDAADSNRDASGYGEPMYELTFHAQGDRRERDRGFYSEAWSFKHSGDVNLYQAERFVKVLKSLSNGLAKVSDADGWHKSLGQYVLRSCKLLGIQAIGLYPPNGESMWASGEKIRYSYRGEIQAQVDRFIVDWMSQTGRFKDAA